MGSFKVPLPRKARSPDHSSDHLAFNHFLKIRKMPKSCQAVQHRICTHQFRILLDWHIPIYIFFFFTNDPFSKIEWLFTALLKTASAQSLWLNNKQSSLNFRKLWHTILQVSGGEWNIYRLVVAFLKRELAVVMLFYPKYARSRRKPFPFFFSLFLYAQHETEGTAQTMLAELRIAKWHQCSDLGLPCLLKTWQIM